MAAELCPHNAKRRAFWFPFRMGYLEEGARRRRELRDLMRIPILIAALTALLALVSAEDAPAKAAAADPIGGSPEPSADGAFAAAEAEGDADELDEEGGGEEPLEAAAEDEEVVEDTEPPSTARASSSSSVQWVVTQKMKAQLIELGYGEAEIAALDAERAAAIIRRSISRPSGGVPTGWNRGGRSKPSALRGAVQAIRKPLSSIGLPSAAVNAVLGTAVLAVGYSVFPKGSGGSMVVERALASELPAEVDADILDAPPPKSDELWLDVQIDRFIDFLKGLFGK